MHSEARGTRYTPLITFLVCAVAVAVAGCGGKEPTRQEAMEAYSQQLRETVSTHVADEHRKEQMLLLLDRLDTVNQRFTQETMDFIQSYRVLNADYDASRDGFDKLFSDYRAKRIKAREQTLDLHFQLASLASAAEWNSIGKAEAELYEHVTRPIEGNAQ